MNSANQITSASQLSAFAQLEIKKRSLLKLLRWTNASSQSKGNLVIAIVVDSSRWETSFPLWLENPGRIGQEYGKKTDMSSRCWLAHAPSISLAVSIERLVLQHNFSPHLTCLCLYVLLSFWFQSCLPVVASEQSLDLNGISVPNNEWSSSCRTDSVFHSATRSSCDWDKRHQLARLSNPCFSRPEPEQAAQSPCSRIPETRHTAEQQPRVFQK